MRDRSKACSEEPPRRAPLYDLGSKAQLPLPAIHVNETVSQVEVDNNALRESRDRMAYAVPPDVMMAG